jgi:hypothetical protein
MSKIMFVKSDYNKLNVDNIKQGDKVFQVKNDLNTFIVRDRNNNLLGWIEKDNLVDIF